MTRRCPLCATPLTRKSNEAPRHFEARETCGYVCAHRLARQRAVARRRADMGWEVGRCVACGGPLPPGRTRLCAQGCAPTARVVFPGATYATLAEVPVRCPRIGCTGLLRGTREGAVCLACGHDLFCAEALARSLALGLTLTEAMT